MYATESTYVQVNRMDNDSSWPANSRVSFHGEVVSIDKANNQIVVRNQDGATGFYNVSDPRSLNDLQAGDQVRIVY